MPSKLENTSTNPPWLKNKSFWQRFTCKKYINSIIYYFIPYFQLTKESRHALQAGEHINKPTLAQEYAILDKAATASETYLKDRLEHLDTLIEDIENAAAQKDAENKMLQKEIEVC